MKFTFGCALIFSVSTSYALESRSLIYSNVGLGYIHSTEDNFSDEAAIQLGSGVQLTENIAVEGIYGTGLSDSSDGSIDIDYYYGFQFRLGSYIYPFVYPFILAGINNVKFDNFDDDSNMTIGIGLAIDLSSNYSLRSEIKRVNSRDIDDLTVVNTGFEFYF